MRVFLHVRSPEQRDWRSEFREMPQVPRLGEFVSLASETRDWFRVELVVYTPYPCDCDAEVYAVAIDHLDVMRDTIRG